MAYKERLQQNNTDLNEILADLDQLPNMPVPNPPAVYQNLEVTENGTYTAGAGYDAIGQVTVNVAGSGGGEVATCTIEIINETKGALLESFIDSLWFVAYENGEYKKYGGCQIDSGALNIIPTNFDWQAEKNTLNNVVCGSMMCLTAHGEISYPSNDWYINISLDSSFLSVPLTPNVTHTLKLEELG